MKRLLDGALLGAGFIAVVAVAFAIAWAGDVFTIDKDGTLKFAVSDAGKITVGATESYVNLVIQNDEVVAESDNKVDITADVLTVEGIRLENMAVSANIETSGAGGLDTGSELADRWYYVWVITNNNGTSANGILTLAPATPNPPTPPVLPAGFTKKRRVGAVRNDASSNFLQFVQEGNSCNYVTTGLRILSAGAAISWTAIPSATAQQFLPPTTRRGKFSMFHTGTASAGSTTALYARRSGGGSAQLVSAAVPASGTVSHRGDVRGECETDDNQVVEYVVAPSGISGYIDVMGYYDRI